VFDDIGQLPLGHVGLDRPGPFGQLPVQQTGSTGTAEHQTWIGDEVDQLLRPNQKASASGALAQRRQQLEQPAVLEA
jgi:hypothetical protein